MMFLIQVSVFDLQWQRPHREIETEWSVSCYEQSVGVTSDDEWGVGVIVTSRSSTRYRTTKKHTQIVYRPVEINNNHEQVVFILFKFSFGTIVFTTTANTIYDVRNSWPTFNDRKLTERVNGQWRWTIVRCYQWQWAKSSLWTDFDMTTIVSTTQANTMYTMGGSVHVVTDVFEPACSRELVGHHHS